MSLKDLTLNYEYRTDASNIIDEFYVPCFLESTEYRRAVGYFTSNGLALAAKGLPTFLSKNGHMRLVSSPLLSPEDIIALVKGYEARDNIIERAILKQLGEEFIHRLTEESRIRLGCLSWLIADGHLDFKIALPSKELLEGGQAIYHEKIGVFTDQGGNSVAFTGSPNETVGGLISNFESIDVYMSWDDQHGRVSRKIDNFENLWANRTARLEIFDFPEAAHKRLLQFRTDRRPTHDPGSNMYRQDTEEAGISIIEVHQDFKPPSGLSLYPHQVNAINAWNATEGKIEQANRSGFLEMATGSGKTLTALCIAASLYEELGRLAIIIVVPTHVLVDQWVGEAERFGLLPITVHSDNPTWRKSAWSLARAYHRKHIDKAVLIATNRSFATTEFSSIISEFDSPTLLIADEAHNLGASKTVEYLPLHIEYRLALSATPKRYFDEEGTQQLINYFGDTVFQFTLKEAIGVCLTPYEYHVLPVELTTEEYDQYQKISAQIKRLQAIKQNVDKETKDSPQLSNLLIKRGRIISSATGKIAKLSNLLDEVNRRELKHTFIYTSDKDPDQTKQVLDLLQHEKRLLAHQFTEEESSDKYLRQQLINRFAKGDDLQVLVAKRCLDEGVDIPPTRRAYFLASTTNPRQYIQRRGRLLRKYPGKTLAIIHDLLVIPPMEYVDSENERPDPIISEFKRIVEFASTAQNGASARASILEVAKRLGVIDIIAKGGE